MWVNSVLCFMKPGIWHRYLLSTCTILRQQKVYEEKEKDGIGYRNPSYESTQIETWWVQIKKPLLSVGKTGVQQSHINNLANLLLHNERVRVKLSSNQMDALVIADQFAKSEEISTIAELLECRKRGFMFGRTRKINK